MVSLPNEPPTPEIQLAIAMVVLLRLDSACERWELCLSTSLCSMQIYCRCFHSLIQLVGCLLPWFYAQTRRPFWWSSTCCACGGHWPCFPIKIGCNWGDCFRWLVLFPPFHSFSQLISCSGLAPWCLLLSDEIIFDAVVFHLASIALVGVRLPYLVGTIPPQGLSFCCQGLQDDGLAMVGFKSRCSTSHQASCHEEVTVLLNFFVGNGLCGVLHDWACSPILSLTPLICSTCFSVLSYVWS